jgi:hypothetical protein
MRMGCAGYVARMKKLISSWGNTEERVALERPGHASYKTAGSGKAVDWIHLAQDRDQRRVFVSVVINLSVVQKAGKILNALNLQEGSASSSYSCHVKVSKVKLSL